MRLFGLPDLHISGVPSRQLTHSFSIQQALHCLANESHLALLDSNGNGGSFLVWGQAPQLCSQVDELTVATGQAECATTATWPLSVDGGALVQIDYEFPVGSWAAPCRENGRAKLWHLKTWLHWQDNICSVHADSEQALQSALLRLKEPPQEFASSAAIYQELRSAWEYTHYQKHIKQIHEFIRQGDIYQVNLTMPFFAEIQQRKNIDIALYLALREQSPAPYSAFFRTGLNSIMSHSPERFLSAHRGVCSSHPIKGTRKRIVGQEATQRQALYDSAKDQAELAMIIDLVRNDLGRIAELGSVSVEQTRYLMDLPYVHHAVGHIQCKLKPQTRLPDMLRACFPSGSITGAPKIRAMDIITQLETQSRGAYCGSFGWIGAGHACELAVAIRTMQMDAKQIRIDAGGGIVIDSVASSEWQELNDKASAMHHALKGFQCIDS